MVMFKDSLRNLWRNWKGIQWPGFSIVLPIKVLSRFLAMSEVDFWYIHGWGNQTREMDKALMRSVGMSSIFDTLFRYLPICF